MSHFQQPAIITMLETALAKPFAAKFKHIYYLFYVHSFRLRTELQCNGRDCTAGVLVKLIMRGDKGPLKCRMYGGHKRAFANIIHFYKFYWNMWRLRVCQYQSRGRYIVDLVTT